MLKGFIAQVWQAILLIFAVPIIELNFKTKAVRDA